MKNKEQEQIEKIRKIVSESSLNKIREIAFSENISSSEAVKLIAEILNEAEENPCSDDVILKELEQLENILLKRRIRMI